MGMASETMISTDIRAQTNSADSDQTASQEAVWSGSSLFAIAQAFRCNGNGVRKISSDINWLTAHANSGDSDQTASEEAVWSGSLLFAICESISWMYVLITNIL